MKWPSLVLPWTQSTAISASIDAEGIDEDGAPITAGEWTGECNWQDVSSRRYTTDKLSVDVAASLYITGDPLPSIAHITGGTVTIDGDVREILKGTKARNPDGTVNYTRLDLR
jgi:hypothetical protein